jgi:hypothetical protein
MFTCIYTYLYLDSGIDTPASVDGKKYVSYGGIYMYLYTRMCVFLYTCIYVNVCTYIFFIWIRVLIPLLQWMERNMSLMEVFICICIHVCVCFLYTCIYVNVCIYVFFILIRVLISLPDLTGRNMSLMEVFMCIYKYIFVMYTCLYVYVYAHKHVYIYIYPCCTWR